MKGYQQFIRQIANAAVERVQDRDFRCPPSCRLLIIQGAPSRVGGVLKLLFGLIFAEGAPTNKSYFKCALDYHFTVL